MKRKLMKSRMLCYHVTAIPALFSVILTLRKEARRTKAAISETFSLMGRYDHRLSKQMPAKIRQDFPRV